MSLFFLFILSAMETSQSLVYTNHWAVQISGGLQQADRIATKYGYQNLGQVKTLFLSLVFFCFYAKKFYIYQEPDIMLVTAVVIIMNMLNDYFWNNYIFAIDGREVALYILFKRLLLWSDVLKAVACVSMCFWQREGIFQILAYFWNTLRQRKLTRQNIWSSCTFIL